MPAATPYWSKGLICNIHAVVKTLCSQVDSKKPSAGNDSLFKWKRFTGALLLVFSRISPDPLKSEESKEACPIAWAEDKGLLAEEE